ncbi:GAF domain-containing protein [Leptospira idonii]|uniref:GAF domain-containing protein n=1 Tax=Leptospira idonii TaxID=1193500 RepID=A0A4R9M1T7_9LEPT|nr:GAF domain-containing protein [Leptospira idonii]TGN20693.1 GAF domain-containing protein [Leptospira idonii]
MGLLDRAESIKSGSESARLENPKPASAAPQAPSLLKKAEQFLSDDSDDWIDDLDSAPASEITEDLPSPDGWEEIDLSDIPDLPPVSSDDSFFDDDFSPEEGEPSFDDLGLGEEEDAKAQSPFDSSDSLPKEDEDLIEREDEPSFPEEPVSNETSPEPEPEDVSVPEENKIEEPQAEENSLDEPTLEDIAPELDEKPTELEEEFPEEKEPEELPAAAEDLIVPEEDEVASAPLPEVDLFEEWEKEAHAESSKHPVRPASEDPAPSDKEFLFDDESDFTTAPMIHHLASKKRIENYQAVFEITKEIASSYEFADFFENLGYSIIGQVGCSSVVILTATNSNAERWDAVNAEGITPKDSWFLYPTDDIYQRLTDSDTIVYAGELKKSRLPDRELVLLNDMESEILVPIRGKNECYGIISLGRLINGEEYITDDLEFVKIIGDIAGSVFTRVAQFEKVTEELENAKQVLEINESVLQSAREFAGVRKMDEAYDLLIDNIKKKLGVKQFSFLVLDSETRSDYVVFGSNFILPERAKDFKLSKDSDIVGMVSNVPGVYRLENFREDSELKSIFTNDELGIMSEFTILPIINLNWLVGMIVVHSTNKPWTDMTRDVAVALLETSAPVLANLLILSEKEALFRNPFNPLENKILSEIEKANQLKLSFTVSLFKIQNISRMVSLFGAGKFARYADSLRKTITDHIGENDFFTRVGQGKFAMILHGKDKEETEIIVKKIKSSFAKKEESFGSNFKPSYRILTLAYPDDTKDKNQFLEMIEEA